ncbi:patatin-like phospholipase family protein [Pararhizobium sp. A13]|uniref:patatin-like phospholipase family protein n=1 Tax=Pararhizobium sp. A13 TaxID=3133975 RepID=UPI00311AED42
MPQANIGPTETQLADSVAGFGWDGNLLEPGIALAMSGGGFRAMLFHAGALMRLNELGLLSKIKRISSVSGGSIAAGHLATAWAGLGRPDANGAFGNFKALYVAPILTFSRHNLDVKTTLIGLLPGFSAAALLAKSYEKYLFGTRTLQDIPDSPRFVFCATNLQSGVLFRFSKPYAGDYVIGRLDKPKIRLSQAVAASSAFPPVLSPLELRLPEGSFTQWPTRSGVSSLSRDELAALRRRVVLTDGGVYDNHGLEPVVKRYMTILVSDGGAPFGRSAQIGFDWVRQLRRILEVTDNQVRALRRRNLIDRLSAGKTAFDNGTLSANETRAHERFGAFWGIDTDAARFTPPDALPCDGPLTDRLARTSTRLTDLGETTSKQLINWGYAICDRSIRTHYRGADPLDKVRPAWPYAEANL